MQQPQYDQTALDPDRRQPGSDAIAEALLTAPTGVSFDELADRVDGATIGDLAAWLGHAMEAGIIERIAGDLGPGRFRLRSRGARVLGSRRRATDFAR